MKIFVFGPQGSGKSTQAVLLAQDLGVPYIQAGEIFRNLTLVDSSKKAKLIWEALEKGKLIPIELASEIINKRLANSDCKNGFVLDGFPRNFAQLENLATRFDKVFYIKVSDEVGVKRLIKRKRADDTKVAIEARLVIYHQQTAPLLEFFKQKNILEEIDGERSISAIHKDIVTRLGIDDIH